MYPNIIISKFGSIWFIGSQVRIFSSPISTPNFRPSKYLPKPMGKPMGKYLPKPIGIRETQSWWWGALCYVMHLNSMYFVDDSIIDISPKFMHSVWFSIFMT